MDDQEQTPNQAKLMLWIIWVALLSAIIAYGFVLQTIAAPGEENGVRKSETIVMTLAGVGVIGLLVSFFVRLKFTRPLAKKLAPEELGKVLPSCIISWALAESVAIYGLVLGFMGYPMSTYGTFFVAGFVAMVFLAPRFAPLIRILPDEER